MQKVKITPKELINLINNNNATFGHIVSVLEEHDDETHLRSIEKHLKERINELQETHSYEDLGVTYYYLVRNALKKNFISSKRLKTDFLKALCYFSKQCKFVLKERRRIKKNIILNQKQMQIIALFKTIETYLTVLEYAFRKKNLTDLASIAFKEKMHYKKKLFLLKKNYMSWIGYEIWSVTSHYGENFFRWGMTSITFVLFFAGIFFISGSLQQVPINEVGDIVGISESTSFIKHPMLHAVGEDTNYFNYIYFSIVTFTTLGYGDVLPVTMVDKVITIIAVISGYLMLGIFITLLGKKV